MPTKRRIPLLLGLMMAAMLASGASPDLDRVERLVIERTNQLRRAEGRTKVEPDAKLHSAAQAFADFMARTDKYGHEADGRKPSGRVAAHGYAYCVVSENISYQYSSDDFATAELAIRYFEGWKKSPGHRANMLERSVTDTAMAVSRSSKTGRYYAVQLFGRPRAAGCQRAS